MTIRLTVAQATIRFLARQYSERDGVERRLISGCFGIFGHGNVAGIGQALLEAKLTGSADLPYYLARNEQGMVHAAAGFARMNNRLQALACTASIGPGSTNMVTGAAGATINRIPVLLLPSDIFATRASGPVLQELEDPRSFDVSVNDAFRPISRFFDRINRPEQLPSALLAAMRVLTDPVDTGAVTIAMPQDVQAEAFDWPEELFARRVWHVGRPEPEPVAVARAADVIRAAKRPLIVAGGGVLYAEASDALRRFADTTGIPVSDTQAGKGAVPWDHPMAVGGVGATGTPVANALGPRRRRRDRRRHPIQRLHHRLPDGVSATLTFGSSTSTSRCSTPPSRARRRSWPTPVAASNRSAKQRPATGSARPTPVSSPSTPKRGPRSSTRRITWETSHCRPRRRSSAW